MEISVDVGKTFFETLKRFFHLWFIWNRDGDSWSTKSGNLFSSSGTTKWNGLLGCLGLMVIASD